MALQSWHIPDRASSAFPQPPTLTRKSFLLKKKIKIIISTVPTSGCNPNPCHWLHTCFKSSSLRQDFYQVPSFLINFSLKTSTHFLGSEDLPELFPVTCLLPMHILNSTQTVVNRNTWMHHPCLAPTAGIAQQGADRAELTDEPQYLSLQASSQTRKSLHQVGTEIINILAEDLCRTQCLLIVAMLSWVLRHQSRRPSLWYLQMCSVSLSHRESADLT